MKALFAEGSLRGRLRIYRKFEIKFAREES